MTDELKQWEYDKGYTKGYSDGRASLIEELEKIKAEVDKKYDELYVIDEFTNGEASAYVEILEIVNEHIAELKGE